MGLAGARAYAICAGSRQVTAARADGCEAACSSDRPAAKSLPDRSDEERSGRALGLTLTTHEQVCPGGDVRTLAEQLTALALGHAPPHTPLDAVVERLREALHAHGAPHAQLTDPLLLGCLWKQGVF